MLLLTEQTNTFKKDSPKLTVDYHYCWIKNLSSLVGSQMSKHEHKKYICDRCLIYFNVKLKEHKIVCENVNDCAIEMPTDEKKI